MYMKLIETTFDSKFNSKIFPSIYSELNWAQPDLHSEVSNWFTPQQNHFLYL